MDFNVEGPRRYPHTTSDSDLSKSVRNELWIYSNASEKAIAPVSYLKAFFPDGSTSTGFLLWKSKVAPVSSHTIPRLELRAAVLAIEVTQIVVENMDMSFVSVKYFTDSRVVLGYIHNDKERFFVYVANRVEWIESFSIQTDGNLGQPTSTLLMKVQLYQRSIFKRHWRLWLVEGNSIKMKKT